MVVIARISNSLDQMGLSNYLRWLVALGFGLGGSRILSFECLNSITLERSFMTMLTKLSNPVSQHILCIAVFHQFSGISVFNLENIISSSAFFTSTISIGFSEEFFTLS